MILAVDRRFFEAYIKNQCFLSSKNQEEKSLFCALASATFFISRKTILFFLSTPSLFLSFLAQAFIWYKKTFLKIKKGSLFYLYSLLNFSHLSGKTSIPSSKNAIRISLYSSSYTLLSIRAA